MNSKKNVDSSMTIDQALSGKEIPENIVADLVLLDVEYFSFDGESHSGQLVVHKDVAEDLREIFVWLEEIKFPIKKVVPIVAYGWDDESSMRDNNSSAFNYRFIYGTDRLSNHALGLAIDINPLLNPCVAIDGTIQPCIGSYDSNTEGTLTADCEAVALFKSHGFDWGGHWERKDWQHFSKMKR